MFLDQRIARHRRVGRHRPDADVIPFLSGTVPTRDLRQTEAWIFASPTTSSRSAISSRNTGMKLCPPARIFAPIGAPDSSSTASAVDVGAPYSKALGIMSLLLRADRAPSPGGGAGHLEF